MAHGSIYGIVIHYHFGPFFLVCFSFVLLGKVQGLQGDGYGSYSSGVYSWNPNMTSCLYPTSQPHFVPKVIIGDI
jgi:hypothetical protein